MKLAFIGGSGHHYIRNLLKDLDPDQLNVAVASDGYDAIASRSFVATLSAIDPTSKIAYFDNGRDMLDSFEPDLVSVGGVYGFNGEWNAETLSRNISTISDKPVAATLAQLTRLKELCAEDASRILLTEFDFHSRREFRAARAAIRLGKIGKTVLVTAQKSYRFGQRPHWYARRDWFGGLVLWIASHGIDAIEFVTGESITRCTGRSGNLSQPKFGNMEDHVAILAELGNGGSAIIHADFCRPPRAASHGDDRLRVVGTSGVVEIPGDGTCRLTTMDQQEHDIADSVQVLPIHQELFAASQRGAAADLYGTDRSLHIADVLLHAREAVDHSSWLNVGR